MSQKPTKPTRGRPKTVDRQRAVKAALEVYWREGIQAMSLNALCRRIDLSKPSLYREFGGEDGLMVATLELYRQLAVVPLMGLFAAGLPPAQTLERAVIATTSDRGTPAGCLFTKMRLAIDRLGDGAATRTREIEAERLAVFAAWYQRVLDAGEGDASITPELAARYLDNQLTSVLVQMALGESPELIRAQAKLALKALVPA